MKQAKSQADIKFIQALKNIVKNTGYMAIHYPDEKTFQIMKKTDKVKDCTEKWVEALEKDFLSGKKSYDYQLYEPNHPYMKPIIDKLTTLDKSMPSSELKLFMLDIFKQPFAMFYPLLKIASHQRDKHLILEILKKPIEYGRVENTLHKKFYQITHRYQFIQIDNLLPLEQVVESFISHLKVSHIEIGDTLLIKTFIDLFTKKYLDRLFKELNLESPRICTDVEKVLYSTFNLNKSAMMVSQIEKEHIEAMVNAVGKSEVSFPSFFVLNETNEYLEIIVRSDNKTQLKEDKAKVMALFEHLLSNHYDIEVDKALGYKQLFNVAQSIEEKFRLDRVMKDVDNVRHQKQLKI